MRFLHIIAFIFFMPALFLTIPLHILIKKPDNKKSMQETSPALPIERPLSPQQEYEMELLKARSTNAEYEKEVAEAEKDAQVKINEVAYKSPTFEHKERNPEEISLMNSIIKFLLIGFALAAIMLLLINGF